MDLAHNNNPNSSQSAAKVQSILFDDADALIAGIDAIVAQDKEPTYTVNKAGQIEQSIKAKSTQMLTAKSANAWIEQAKLRPIPKMLFAELWAESEVCILFSDTNLGKSILAVQIADSISRGISIPHFKLESKKQQILYFDFELSEKQFEGRYCVKNEVEHKYENHYLFDDNFIRVQISRDADKPEGQTFEECIVSSMESLIIESSIKVLIVDNLTYLKEGTETAKDALPLMKKLIGLKRKYDLSILVLAHTPKRDLTRPISENDLQGSKMLMNFADSAFTIGRSGLDNNLRYIKQIKERNTEKVYGSEHVIVCKIDKPDNFLQFEFVRYDNECEHLKQQSENDTANRNEKIKELSGQGKSFREIGAAVGISHTTVSRILLKGSDL